MSLLHSTSVLLAMMAPLTGMVGTDSMSATTSSPATTVLRISARVPTICRVEFTHAAVAQTNGALELGAMGQFCNSAEGYRVIMTHPIGLTGAHVVVGGRSVALSAGSQTVIVDSSIPRWEQSDVRVELGDNGGALSSLAFRSEPKGSVF